MTWLVPEGHHMWDFEAELYFLFSSVNWLTTLGRHMLVYMTLAYMSL